MDLDFNGDIPSAQPEPLIPFPSESEVIYISDSDPFDDPPPPYFNQHQNQKKVNNSLILFLNLTRVIYLNVNILYLLQKYILKIYLSILESDAFDADDIQSDQSTNRGFISTPNNTKGKQILCYSLTYVAPFLS